MNNCSQRALRVGAALLLASLVLGGCSSFKKLTGQRDDTILPGQREDVLPPEQQVINDPNMGNGSGTSTQGQASTATGTGQSTAKQAGTPQQGSCDPANPDCIPPVDASGSVDQESSDVFGQ